MRLATNRRYAPIGRQSVRPWLKGSCNQFDGQIPSSTKGNDMDDTAEHKGWQEVWHATDREQFTFRLKVPGGWLYRHERPEKTDCMAFVPDP